MRPFLRDLLIFALLTATAYPLLVVGASLLYKHGGYGNVFYALGGNGHLWTRVRDTSVPPPHDVLVLGSSLAYRGFDPRIFKAHGISMFNLGSSRQTALQGEVLTKHYWDRSHPRLVIIAVSPDMFMAQGVEVESTLDLIANDRLDALSLRMACATGNIRVMNTLLYAGVRQALALDTGFKESDTTAKDIYIPGGYVERVPRAFATPLPAISSNAQPAPQQLRAFHRTVEFIKAQGARLVLISPPTTPMRHNGNERAWAQQLWSATAPFYDMSAFHGGPDSTYFYDGTHQNQAGVERFNEALISILRRDGHL